MSINNDILNDKTFQGYFDIEELYEQKIHEQKRQIHLCSTLHLRFFINNYSNHQRIFKEKNIKK